MPSEQENPREGASCFATTHWSVVLSAAKSHSPRAEEALETLSLTYWYPLYVYLRRKGLDVHAAEDMTQDFFARRVLTGLIFKGVTPDRGKFRSWLLTSLQNFQRNEWDRQKAQKRGGDRPHVSIDLQDGEDRYLAEPSHDLTPEKIYERVWAMTLLDQAIETLREKYTANGADDLFGELKQFLPGATSNRRLEPCKGGTWAWCRPKMSHPCRAPVPVNTPTPGVARGWHVRPLSGSS